MKNILITGAGSYIGTSVEKYLRNWPEEYSVKSVDMIDGGWKQVDFSAFDVVYHVAGIAHADTGRVSEETKALYYKVNTNLAVEVAKKAKEEGIKQFIFMSSMIIYGGCKETTITRETQPTPLNFYGDSKWQADQQVRCLMDDKFKVVVLRPPMIYGKDSKGNYPQLSKIAKKLPFFPKSKNRRSMLYIENLCEFVRLMIENEESGIFFPQNKEYTNTSELVKLIASANGHRIAIVPGTNWTIRIMMHAPGKAGRLAQKAFGDSKYDMSLSRYKTEYQLFNLKQSILRTEK